MKDKLPRCGYRREYRIAEVRSDRLRNGAPIQSHALRSLKDEAIFRNRHAFLAMLSGLVSLSLAWLGGMLARFIMGLGVVP